MEGNKGNRQESRLVLAIILILVGVIALAVQVLHIQVGRYLWPFTVIVPGVALLVVGLWLRGTASEGLTIAGSIVTSTGLLLFVQNVTGLWATWAYAWALVTPGSVGLALMLYGTLNDQPEKVRSGRNILRVAFWILVVGFVFFELIIGLSGFGLNRQYWPFLLIAIGAALLVKNLVHHGRERVE